MKKPIFVSACWAIVLAPILLSAGAAVGSPRSCFHDLAPLISTPFPAGPIGRPWGARPARWGEVRPSFLESVRPLARQTNPCLAGENLAAVNVYLSNDFAAEDAVFIVGEVQNTGTSVQNDIIVQFFLGDPDGGGTQIGQDRIVPSLAPGSTAYDSVSWSGFTGRSQIYCVVDPHQAIDEENETDNTDSLTVGMVNDVPWVWQEVNGYCHYASQTMLFNYHGADNTVYETLELACCPHSVAYQDDWLTLYSGWYLSQGIGDIEFAGQIRNLNTDLVVKPTWTSYLSELRSRIDAGIPCETSVDPYWLPQPDYDLLRTYGLHSGHGVVIVGYTDDAIVCNDPGVGLDLVEEPAIPHPENRGANVVIDQATFRNAVEWTAGSRYLLLSYVPGGAMPSHEQMLVPAVDRSLLRLWGDAGTFDPAFWQIFDIYGRDCFPSLRVDATAENFQAVFAEAMSQTGGDLADAINVLASACDLWGCGICWNAAAVFYGAQGYPQASELSGLSAQLSAKGDQIWGEYVDLLEAVYVNGGNTSIAEPYLSQMRSILDEIIPLEDSVLVELDGLSGYLTEVEAGDMAERLPREPELVCYPNPFNGRTVLRFSLQDDGPVSLTIYNIMGQQVRTLADGLRQAGAHRIVWDGRDDHGRKVSSGLYFCRMGLEATARAIKIVLLQ
jgi:hypothetical protein